MSRSPQSRRSTPVIYIGRLPSSPIGPLWAAVSEKGLVAIDWDMSQGDFTQSIQRWFKGDVIYDASRVASPLHQLSEFLVGRLKEFTCPIDLTHLPQFQQRALRLTIEIPYGETTTYKEIAIQAGNPLAARAVGRAEATNPIPLVIPCHRVLGTDGSLHGYGGPGGIAMKAWLLYLEHTHK